MNDIKANCFDYSPPPGWVPVVEAAIEALEKLRETEPDLADLGVDQVKEKFAGLRLYTTHDGHKLVDLVVQVAELACGKMCQRCGAAGDICSDVYWMRRLCDGCAKEA